MPEQTNELRKLVAIAADLDISSELRNKAVEQIGRIGTYEALLALLELVSNEKLVNKEREFALKQAGRVLKSNH